MKALVNGQEIAVDRRRQIFPAEKEPVDELFTYRKTVASFGQQG
jgi:hypothetical protein